MTIIEDLNRLKAAILKETGFLKDDTWILNWYRVWSDYHYSANWLMLPKDEKRLIVRVKTIIAFYEQFQIETSVKAPSIAK